MRFDNGGSVERWNGGTVERWNAVDHSTERGSRQRLWSFVAFARSQPALGESAGNYLERGFTRIFADRTDDLNSGSFVSCVPPFYRSTVPPFYAPI
jgi:hypothetical protein